ncbi:hypothetical protein Back11_04330 [Paenibacillus baekrokdamisoli]|uniref:Uncharacterized protein n=1 Tax=Paenibacillus baekrokdamisoli TaxID=1712516 RepID=A0A3G9J5T3_9BACL|nr:endospore germination permease [Paenibacillus baekrokdamisoli]MBB3067729.1 spore germination protein (amino acid permease) [Paenibacillus baekrokdamisoli]BBH19088.1 hypothetical protein Back11_04330 [Paenibacillus baekrokdamisoli]
MDLKKIGMWPIFMMLALSVGLSSHVITLPTILAVSRRDSWMCSIVACAVLIPWFVVVIGGIMKRTNQTSLRQWLVQRLSPAGAWIILGPILFFLIMTSFQTFIETTAWTSSTFLPATPDIILAICLMLLVVYGAWNGLRTIAYMSCILLPPVVLLGDLVMTANMPDKNYSFLLPMLENGWGVMLEGSFYAICGLIELSLIIFIQHHLPGKLANWKLLVLLIFLMLLGVGPAMGAITEFGPIEADKLRYPAFSQWRLVTVGKYIEHLDFFAIFQWLSGAFIRVSLGLVLAMELIPLRTKKSRSLFLLVVSVLFIASAKFLMSRSIQVQTAIKITFLVEIIIIVFVTTLLWLLSFKQQNKGGSNEDGPKPTRQPQSDSETNKPLQAHS